MSNYFAHTTATINTKAIIGAGTKIWHYSHIMEATIGENCILGQNTFVANEVHLGDNVKVQNNVSIYTGVLCEDNVFIGPSVVFTNVINPRSFVERKEEFKSTKIGKGASIGANATILCGNTIGKYAMIGAGAVVTKNVKDFQIVIGNPSVHKGWVSMLGQKLELINNKAICPQDGSIYILKNEILSIIS